MSYQHAVQRANQAHNQAGCPHLNQTGMDAVLDWRGVLAAIDPTQLPAALQAELRRLQLEAGAANVSAAAQ